MGTEAENDRKEFCSSVDPLETVHSRMMEGLDKEEEEDQGFRNLPISILKSSSALVTSNVSDKSSKPGVAPKVRIRKHLKVKTAYGLFCSDIREEIKKESAGLTVHEVNKEV